MTRALTVAGGVRPAEDAGLLLAHAPGDDTPVRLRYPATPGGSYPMRVGPARVSVVLASTERGFIARAPVLGALGYGDTWEAALEDLAASMRQYLEFIRDDAPRLAPATAHHAAYVSLLDEPSGVWFASVIHAAPLE